MTRSSQPDRSVSSGSSVSSSSMRTSCWWRESTRVFVVVVRSGTTATPWTRTPAVPSSSRMRAPDASSPVQPATSAWTPRPGEVERDVARATDRRGLAAEPDDGDRCLGRDACDFADEIPVEHQVTDDEHARAGEAAAHARVHEVRAIKHRAPLPPLRCSTR